MKTLSLVAALGFTICALITTPAAAGPVGEWRIADGSANVAIRPCGAHLCGYVSWSKETASLVGTQVLINMKRNGEMWAGTVVGANDGQKYMARISLQGESVLKVEGCVMGGMICGGQNWSRLR